MRLLLIILLSCINVCYADVYEQTDPGGTTVYSDTPLNNNAIKIPASNLDAKTSTSPAKTKNPQANQIGNTALSKDKLPYNLFVISSPGNQETIQNQPIIGVEFKTDPALQPGDMIQLLLDGVPFGKPVAGTHIDMSLVPRGTHQLSATLLDSNGTVVKSTSSATTIYVHQAHLGGAP